MAISSTFGRPFSYPCECYYDPKETREARAQELASLLPKYLPNASREKISALATYVISELPRHKELPWRQRQFPCTVRSDPVTCSRFFFLKHQPAVSGAHRKVKTILCLLPNNTLILAKKVVPYTTYASDELANSLEHQEYDLRILSNPRLKDAKGLPKVHAVISYPWRYRSVQKPCIIMEHFDGELKVLLREVQEYRCNPPVFRELVSIILQMAEGIFALHTHVDEQGKPDPIGHYDIKLQNFLFRIEHTGFDTRKFVVALCDFGIHCHVRRTPDKDDIRQWYIAEEHLYPWKVATAPELVISEGAPTDNSDACLKADIWAFGIASLHLMHALRWRTAIVDEHPMWAARLDLENKTCGVLRDVRKGLLSERDRLLSVVRKDYSQESAPLIDIIEMMLTPDPSRRPFIEVVKQEIERVVVDCGAH